MLLEDQQNQDLLGVEENTHNDNSVENEIGKVPDVFVSMRRE